MVMGKKVWAVCCGAVRTEFEFYCSMAMLCDYRSKGLIEGIVISTWNGEVDNFCGLRDKLKEWNIHVIELSPIDESMGQYMDLTYMRQAFQLKAGLDYIPDDVFVLRCRTDYSEDKIRAVEKVLTGNVDLTLGKHGALDTGLHYRIAVMQFSLVYKMFFLVDSGFLGYKDDIYKMCCFDAMNYRYGHRLVVDARFFTNLFSKLPLIDDCITMNLLENYILYDALQKYLQSEERSNFELPEILNKFFALYFVLLNNCFYLLTSKKLIRERNIDFADMFLGKSEIGMGRSGDLQCVKDAELLQTVISGNCKPTKGYIKLLYEINRIALPGYADNLHCLKGEYSELYNWIKNILHINPQRIIQMKIQVEEEDYRQTSNVDFEGVIQFYFNQCHITDNKKVLYKIVKDICNTENYYGAIIDNLSKIKNCSEKLLNSVLQPANRTRNSEVMALCAKKLFYGKVDLADVEAIKYGFERFFRRKDYFSFPLHPYKLSAYYYYGKYVEELGNSLFSELFYKKIIESFDVEETVKADFYSDRVLFLIIEIVNTNYSKYWEDKSIQFMVDFLVDESFDERLSLLAQKYLQGAIWNRKYFFPIQKEKNAITKLIGQLKDIKSKEEVIYVVKLLLREAALLNEYLHQSELEKIMQVLVPKFQLDNMWFSKVYKTDQERIMDIACTEIQSDDDFCLLCNILASKKCLEKNQLEMMKICEEIVLRHFIYWTFVRLEKDKNLRFLAIKNEREIWFNYQKFIDTQYDQKLVLLKNGDGLYWPQGNSANYSCFAGFIRVECDNSILVRIELSSGECTARKKLLEMFDQINEHFQYFHEARIIRLQQKKFFFENIESISGAVNSALDAFCEMGNYITDIVKRVKDLDA